MDGSLFRAINRLADRTSWAHGFFRSYADYGIVLFAVLLVVVYLVARGTGENEGRRRGGVGGAGGARRAGARAADRRRGEPRPTVRGHAERARAHQQDHRFLVSRATTPPRSARSPSGLFLANRRWGVVAMVLAVVMAFARVYAGAHYPGDVLAGLTLGGTAAALGSLVAVPLLTRVVSWLSATALRPAVTSAPDPAQVV